MQNVTIPPPILESFTDKLLTLLALGFWVYLLQGALPFSVVEGDQGLVVQGASYLKTHGWIPEYVGYLRGFFAGTYWGIVSLQKICELNSLDAYGYLSLVGFLGFLGLLFYYVKRRSKAPLWIILTVASLVQELWVSTYYSSSNAVALPFMMGGWLLLEKKSYLSRFSGLIFCLVALWMRIDVLLVFPVLALEVFLEERSTKNPTSIKGWFGLGTVAVLLVFFLDVHVSLLNLIQLYLWHSSVVLPFKEAIERFFTLGTLPVLILTYFGMVRCKKKGLTKELRMFIFLGGILFLAFCRSFTTPKYLLYLTPLWVLMMTQGFLYLKERSQLRGVKAILVVSVFFQYIGLPTINRIQVVTADQPRRVTHIFGSPSQWKEKKKGQLRLAKEWALSLESITESLMIVSPSFSLAFMNRMRVIEAGAVAVDLRVSRRIERLDFVHEGKNFSIVYANPYQAFSVEDLKLQKNQKLVFISNKNTGYFKEICQGKAEHKGFRAFTLVEGKCVDYAEVFPLLFPEQLKKASKIQSLS